MTRTVRKVQRDESRTQGLHRLELIRLLLVGKGNKSTTTSAAGTHPNLAVDSRRMWENEELTPRLDDAAMG